MSEYDRFFLMCAAVVAGSPRLRHEGVVIREAKRLVEEIDKHWEKTVAKSYEAES